MLSNEELFSDSLKFFENHYRNQGYKIDVNKKSLVPKFSIKKNTTILIENLIFSDIYQYLIDNFFYHEIFLHYNDMSTIGIFLHNRFEFQIKHIGIFGWCIMDNRLKKISNFFKSTGELIQFIYEEFDYSLEKVIPYICPDCNNHFIEQDFSYPSNVQCFKCECGYKHEEIL